MTRAPRPWNRLLWGVKFSDATGDRFLIGSTWHRDANLVNKGYPGEPTRALLFQTRNHARAFCWEQLASYKKLGGHCAKWKLKPVRVREKVSITR